ncbi:hypothetical protein GS597_12370 [Synechococcales cyanobacterium C]|uniref:Uncharacterized protein n=1 Tax=Petrachloros mirabilis ULC683 TaxID=2781853 RepID=A0A8K2A0E9_9CYAN|nr:hypothetical protein [Petrachloros mirabilis]NCJ07286.1 hypothetical protein [Petrachloros mirabilis ULC683]
MTGFHQLQMFVQPLWVPVCAALAWLLVVLGSVSLGRSLRNGWLVSKRLHQIPCSHCRFFTGNYLLKCSVHPQTALSEAAIHCQDYCKSHILDA